MKYKDVLGIDVSKKTIDVKLHCTGVHRIFNNNGNGYRSLIIWLKKQTTLDVSEILICFENTGLYSLPLAMHLSKNKVVYVMVPALEIKRSLGLVRGKNDKIDASRIAEYAFLRRNQLQPFELPSKNILTLQKLISLRDKMVKQRAGFLGGLKEYKTMLKQKDYELLFETHKKMIHYLSKQITIIEKKIIELINSDPKMKEIYDLITSIKGVGPVLASNLLVVTNCFMSFKDSRKFACYAGLAPFENQSGTSLRRKSRVSHFANKKMKALLNLAASSAIQADPELKAYYHRRVNSGKSKMSTLNIVRNKIVHRVFAVVKRGTPYVPLHLHVA